MSRQRIFDSHVHIIDQAFPLVANNGFLPEPFSVDAYRNCTADLGIAGGAVVSGSFQGFDQSYLEAALHTLGPEWVGVTQLPSTVSDAEIVRLHEVGVRAVRFNLRRGGSAGLDDLDRLASRVYDLCGWHAELYVDARDLRELGTQIQALPAVSIDHLGLHQDGLPTLLELVSRGVKVKATGFGRVQLDPAAAIRRILDVNPSALMVGTDLPSTRARRPFERDDFSLIEEIAGDHAQAVFWDNAAAWYLSGTRGDAFPSRRTAEEKPAG